MCNILRSLLCAFPLLGLLWGEVSAIATITKPITTPFGTYAPKSVSFTPAVPPYTVPEDLSGVLYADSYNFSETARGLLVRNGFVAAPADAQSFTAIYKATNDKQLPVFVTVDAVLHSFYKTYDHMLRIAEYRLFYDQLDSMLTGMLDAVKPLRSSSANDSLKLAVTRAAALLDVAHTLLTDTMTFTDDSAIRTMVAAETSLVYRHEGFVRSAVVPDLDEDFSQYVPRGHYTLDKKFERYFRSMMYLGRMNLSDTLRIETMMACILTRLWSTAKNGSASVSDLWAKIYNPTAFFVGYSDDHTFTDYEAVLDRAVGAAWRSGDISVFYTKLAAIMTELKKLPKPRILSGLSLRPGLRMMGQRFVPDSYAFGQLVYDKVGTDVAPRLFPRGLDVLAVLGSQRARQHLINMYHEDQYVNYTKQLDSLTLQFAAMPDTQWTESLYWNWLYTLVPLLQIPGKGYPFFMTTQAWADKSITSASGSWAELRHASILYAKQSYTGLTGVGPGNKYVSFPQGYVEPNPEAFGRIAAMAEYMKNGFNLIELAYILPLDKLTMLETLCTTLRDIAARELESSSLPVSHYCTIAAAYKDLNAIENFSNYSISSSDVPDTSTALIVDVHTDPNSDSVLEVGTGKPMCLYVVVPVEGKLQVCRGAMFSYYEFKHPMNDRLTDAKWQAMLDSSNRSMPKWTDSFTGPSEEERFTVVKKMGTYSLPMEDLTTIISVSDSIPDIVRAGDSLIAILWSDTTPAILVESVDWFEGTLISPGRYRVAIPPSALSDTNTLIVHITKHGFICGNCWPPVTTPPEVPISYRKIVYRYHVDASVNRRNGVPAPSTRPSFKAGCLTLPRGASWRIVDACGRLIATLGPETVSWVVPQRLASRVLILLPEGKTAWKPMTLVISR